MKILAPKYYREFNCIGTECEASCCDYPWKISVDRKQYKNIKSAYDKNKEDREFFKNSIRRIKTSAETRTSEMLYAYMNQNIKGTCSLLDKNNLCGLINKVGEEILPRTCSVYPRLFNSMGKERLDTAMALSCPEVTRKCILDSESHKIEEITVGEIGTNFVHTQFTLSSDTITFYNAHVDNVKNFVINILSDINFPLKSRLFFIAFFSNKSKSFLYKGTEKDTSVKLKALYHLLDNLETKEMLHNQLKEINVPSEIGMGILQQCVIIQPKINNSLSHFLTKLFKETVLNCIEQVNDDKLINSNVDINRKQMSVLWQFYLNRKCAINELCGNLIESRLTQYCIHFWMVNWYEQSENLLIHTRRCLVYKAIISFLIYCHKDLNYLIDSKCVTGQAITESIDKVIVECIYSFSRDTGNQEGMVKLLERHLDYRQMKEFAPIMLLIDF